MVGINIDLASFFPCPEILIARVPQLSGDPGIISLGRVQNIAGETFLAGKIDDKMRALQFFPVGFIGPDDGSGAKDRCQNNAEQHPRPAPPVAGPEGLSWPLDHMRLFHQCIIALMSNIGRSMATTIKPVINPMTRIIKGSSRLLMIWTASSVSRS